MSSDATGIGTLLLFLDRRLPDSQSDKNEIVGLCEPAALLKSRECLGDILSHWHGPRFAAVRWSPIASLVNSSADIEFPALEIHVAPLQTDELAQAETGERSKNVERRILLGRVASHLSLRVLRPCFRRPHECPHFLTSERVHPLVRVRRLLEPLDSGSSIRLQAILLARQLEDPVNQDEVLFDRAVRDLRGELVAPLLDLAGAYCFQSALTKCWENPRVERRAVVAEGRRAQLLNVLFVSVPMLGRVIERRAALVDSLPPETAL